MPSPQPLQQPIVQKNGLIDLVWASYLQARDAGQVSTPPSTPLSANKDVQTDGSALLVSIDNTGTNNNVMSTSPTFDSKITVTTDVDTATVSASGLITSGSLNTGDVTANDLVINDMTANDLTVNDITGNDLFVNDINAVDVTINGLTTTNGGIVRQTVRITEAYTVLSTDYTIYANTDSGDYPLYLPVGTEGAEYEVLVSGSNTLTMTPNGTDKLFGENASFDAYDLEGFTIKYNTIEGWR